MRKSARVVGDKLKIFPPSAEAHRLIRSEITDNRKLQAHTFLLPQDKQLKIVIRGLPHDYPTEDLIEDLRNESFHVEYVTQLKHRGGKENNQSTSNTPLSDNQDILVIKTLLQDFMSKFSTALEALTAQKSSKSSIQ
ncbi:hypothetical protein CDAR_83731 [Caerostris darwini]|uniref:Uncharacterized protein n=1 Tax=Caerostris darwini TaxID=1538125 RepID=A0AAV4UKD7_9ARAC|nr:hypothetical protein CDAR_83731 [Caerostris darwini]